MKHFSVKKAVSVGLIVLVAGGVSYKFLIKKYSGPEFCVAETGKTSDIIEASGIAVRNEIIISPDNYKSDNLKYLLSDGEKVPQNGSVAQLYDNPTDSANSYKIDAIDKEIEVLERLNLFKSNISKGVNFINKQINEEIKNLLISIDDMRLSESDKNKQNILYLLNEKQIILGKNVNLEERINNLKSEKQALVSLLPQNAAVISSPASGEFIGHTDGYENFIDYKSVLKSDVNNIDFEYSAGETGGGAGKIIASETWYIICKMSKESSSHISAGSLVNVGIASINSSSEVPCTAEAIAPLNDGENAVVIFSCDYMNKDLAAIRKDEFKITVAEYEGIKINKNALHHAENADEGDRVYGVYVKIGGYLKLKNIIPVYFDSENVIGRYETEQYQDENYLQPGDKVVLSGTDLYNGKKC